MTSTLKIGVLGAARISQIALYEPVADTDGVEIVAIAARDKDRAQAHATAQGIPVVHDSYEALLADPNVDAVYNPLPVSLHHRWTVTALTAGKHVLGEKPFAANADLARDIVKVQGDARLEDGAALVCMEAFHWRYHPLATEMEGILRSGILGDVTEIDAGFNVEIPSDNAVRHSYALAGGALMDLGCYPVQWVRFVCGGEPTVLSAEMQQGEPDVDVDTRIELECPGGIPATIQTVMTMGVERQIWLAVYGSKASMHVDNPLAPQFGHRLTVTGIDGAVLRDDQVEGKTSYHHQLEAFVDAVQNGTPLPTGGEDSVANMAVIDAAYLAAGMPLRQGA